MASRRRAAQRAGAQIKPESGTRDRAHEKIASFFGPYVDELLIPQLKELRDAHGADSIGGFTSARCTNEDNYVFQKFMRAVIGTNNVDHCARL